MYSFINIWLLAQEIIHDVIPALLVVLFVIVIYFVPAKGFLPNIIDQTLERLDPFHYHPEDLWGLYVKTMLIYLLVSVFRCGLGKFSVYHVFQIILLFVSILAHEQLAKHLFKPLLGGLGLVDDAVQE